MRFRVWAAAVVCAAWAAGPAPAQMGSASTILGGPPPSAIQFKPIDVTHAVAPTPGLAAQQSRFNFASLFSRMTTPTFPIKQGISPLPSASSFPTYPNFKMVGKPPYQLGDPRAAKNPFQPVMPIIPNTAPPVGPGSK